MTARAIPLSANPDILAGLGAARAGRKRPVLIGFAAETEDVVNHGRAKLRAKSCDLIVANDVSRVDSGFSSDSNQVTLIGPDGDEALPLLSKDEVAHAIWDRVVKRLATDE